MFVEYIDNDDKWNEFLEHKLNSNFISKREKEQFSNFVLNRKYKEITKGILKDTYFFNLPKKHIISKGNSSKKRIVYSFNENETIILKYITYLLYDYDFLFQNNLFSFRKSINLKTAIYKVNSVSNIKNMYAYKLDIKNYFNSIDVNILLNNLKQDIKDKELVKFIENILLNKKVIYDNKEIIEEKGAMAGIPISSFLANYYIKEIDQYFANEKVMYFRYSDDILIFCNSKKDIIKYSNKLKELLKKYKLDINPDKENIFYPGQSWEFLGFSFSNGTIDLSNNTINKINSKIRRSARSIRRWMLKNNVCTQKAMQVMTRKYNKKFYGNDNIELSWKWWFFPVINTNKGLKKVDNYLQQNLRYIVTGRHNKKNYKIVPYIDLKKANYKSLVREYYLFVNMKGNM